MKNIILVLIIIIAVIFGVIGLKVLLFPVNRISQSIDMTYEIVDKTLDGGNAIYNYEWFKEQEGYIRRCLKNEEIAEEEYNLFLSILPKNREKWDKQDKEEESSLRNSYYALQKLTNKAIEEYNAKSEMVNRAIFKDNLPSNISRSLYVGKKLTN